MPDAYLQTVEDYYAQAARVPEATLCCTTAAPSQWPGLVIPPEMQAMNYGCGATVEPRDLRSDQTILYVGVGGGLEALQFAYFTRRPNSVIALDPVGDMRQRALANLQLAARVNPWFQPDFVDVRPGNALDIPLPGNSVDVAAQNCLFNIFQEKHLQKALAEIVRVLRFGGFFSTSDPITPTPLPEAFRADDLARARCLSGCLTFEEYVDALVDAGFGRVEVRRRFPYRYVTPSEFAGLASPVLLESIEIVAYKVPDGYDGPEVHTGREAIYTGSAETYTDESGAVLRGGIPQPVSDAAARRLAKTPDVIITPATYHSRGGGCC